MRLDSVRASKEPVPQLLQPLILAAAAALAFVTVGDILLAQPSQAVFGVSMSVLLVGFLAELRYLRQLTVEELRASARREAAVIQIARRSLENDDLEALLVEVAALVAWALDVDYGAGLNVLRRRRLTAGDREFLEAVAWILDAFIARRATAQHTRLVHPSRVD